MAESRFVNVAEKEASDAIWALVFSHPTAFPGEARRIEALIDQALSAARKDERKIIAAETKTEG